MAVKFPSPAVDGQVYPDVENGDTALENGRIYIYNSSKGIWELKPKDFTSSGGALELSAIPKLVRHDSYQRFENLVWDFKFENGNAYRSARCVHPKLATYTQYWDGKWWAIFTEKEFDAEIYTSTDDGETWQPFDRLSKQDYNYKGVGYYTDYIRYVRGMVSNDDCLMISWQSLMGDKYISVIKKGETEFKLFYKHGSEFSDYPNAMNSDVAGVIYFLSNKGTILRTFDNGDTYDIVDMKFTNGTAYNTSSYHNVYGLPDGRLITKRAVTPDGGTDWAYRICVSSDQGENWTITDLDLDSIYKYTSGKVEDVRNRNSDASLWVANGIVFNSVPVSEVNKEETVDEHYGTSYNYCLFYTTDLDSGVWNPVKNSGSRYAQSIGYYNPNDKRYYAQSFSGQIMCSESGKLTSDGWRHLDKYGYDGFGGSEISKKPFDILDERNNRLVFFHPGTWTFDYYKFASNIKGLGEDISDNRLVTFKDLDDYIKVPYLYRNGVNTDKLTHKLSWSTSRVNKQGKNYPFIYPEQTTYNHKFYIKPTTSLDEAPKEGQCGIFTKSNSSSNKYVPQIGRGPNGWFGIHRKDLYNNWVWQDYFETTDSGGREHAIEVRGTLFFTNYRYVNGDTGGYPRPYFMLNFNYWTFKKYTLWVSYDANKLHFPSYNTDSTRGYPGSWKDVEKGSYYMYACEGLPMIFHDYGNDGLNGFNKKTFFDYST